MLDNLLSWSRLNVGSLNNSSERYNINDIIAVSLEEIGVQAENKSISLVVQNNTNVDVYCDANMISTILRNLVSNAIKFSKEGTKITIIVNDYKEDNNFVEVVVQDEGVGMDPDKLNKLFRLDHKVTTVGTSGELGTGLGLILCKEFIDKHNCQIWAESEIGVGTSFHFTLAK